MLNLAQDRHICWHCLCNEKGMGSLHSLHQCSPVAFDLLVYSWVILVGIGLANVRMAGVKLGIAGVLFAGLLTAHLGLPPNV